MTHTENANAKEPHVTIVRWLDAPRELVFAAWTEPERVAQWWGPRGFTAPLCEVDARPGGKLRIHMRAPDGTIYPMSGIHEEIVPPERIVTLNEANNDAFRIRQVVKLEDHGDRTKLTLQAYVVYQTPAAADSLAGMEIGWNQSLDRLTEYLTR
jgi:uncharacterized protein YndB with AHSA1/START domain